MLFENYYYIYHLWHFWEEILALTTTKTTLNPIRPCPTTTTLSLASHGPTNSFPTILQPPPGMDNSGYFLYSRDNLAQPSFKKCLTNFKVQL